jgi:large subunit ribosomal protein L13
MNTLSYKTVSVNAQTAQKEWVVIDCTDQVVGRLCSKVAKLLRGKYKPNFTPHVDCGDNVIIINADKIQLTGKKMTDHVYLSYSGYPGGQKKTTPAEILAKKGGYEKLIRRVVKGMLPKTKLASRIILNLHVYEGAEHAHEAQQPKSIDINLLK